ncbi:MAG: hypothetical protein WA667_20820 [Candidatus Nitrosopolaris sp.]
MGSADNLDLYYVVCGICKQEMEYKVNFAQEHLAMYPDHMKYEVRTKEKN